MLKSLLAEFYDLADQARAKFGDSAPKVTDEIIAAAFPETFAASTREGCETMFRNGVKEAVAKFIRKPAADARQRTFDDIASHLLPFAEKLSSVAYYVPTSTGGEYVSVPDLCADLAKLDAARKFTRQKGEETLREAKRLDNLYAAATGS
jgi:hypothetical protein